MASVMHMASNIQILIVPSIGTIIFLIHKFTKIVLNLCNYFTLYAYIYIFAGGISSGSESISELVVFQENYAMLCNIITEIEDLLKYFKIEYVITSDEEEEIRSIPVILEKTKRIMLNISTSLEAGNNSKFYAMLKVMKNYGLVPTQKLSDFIMSRLKSSSTFICPHTVFQALQGQGQLVTGLLYIKVVIFTYSIQLLTICSYISYVSKM